MMRSIDRRGVRSRVSVGRARLRSEVQDVADAWGWLGTRRRTVVYLGWTAAANLGDAACRSAASELLPSERVVDWSRARRPLVDRARRLRPAMGLMLGGGTLIGRHGWYDAFAQADRSLGVQTFAIGVGFEDPESVAWGLTSNQELERWIPALAAARFLSVRGDRSAEILSAHGITAPVTGDLALALSAPPTNPADKLLGVCVAAPGDGVWGSGTDEILNTLTPVVSSLIRDGWDARLYVLFPRDDRQVTVELARRLRLGPRVTICEPATPRDLLADIGRCTVVAGMRLHSLVLASVAGVPTVALAYRPKCEEFVESVGRGSWSLRTSSLSPGSLRDMIVACAAERVRQSFAVLAQVAHWRGRLFAASGSLVH
jgi:hypothetical protein